MKGWIYEYRNKNDLTILNNIKSNLAKCFSKGKIESWLQFDSKTKLIPAESGINLISLTCAINLWILARNQGTEETWLDIDRVLEIKGNILMYFSQNERALAADILGNDTTCWRKIFNSNSNLTASKSDALTKEEKKIFKKTSLKQTYEKI